MEETARERKALSSNLLNGLGEKEIPSLFNDDMVGINMPALSS